MFFLSTSDTIFLFVSGFGMLQGILLAGMLYFHPRSDRSVTTFLALYILCVSIPILIPVGQHLFSWQFIFLIEPSIVLIGPFLYLYICSFRETITWRKTWPHLILFFIYIVIAIILYNEVGGRYPRTEKVPPKVPRHPLSYIPVSVRMVQRIVYYFIALRALRSYQRSIMHLFSETSRINLRWVSWLVNGHLFLVLFSIVVYSLILKFPEQINLWLFLMTTMVCVYLYAAAFKGISQPTLWQAQPGMTKEKLQADMQQAEQLEIPLATRTGMQEDKLREMTNRILILMEQEKLYQEPELALQHLADRLQCPSYQVSQAINDGLGKNFYDLVNGYRVEEAKRLLSDPGSRNYTILSVGFEAGFNSKTTFNTVFKKFTGLTPTEFRAAV